jgi:hypothetical protein
MPFHAVYNSRRATPSRPSITVVWGELLRRYVKPELNAKSGPEELSNGILFLRRMGYTVVDSENGAVQADITPSELPELLAVVGTPRAPKPERKPKPAAKAKVETKPAAAAKKK